MKYYIVNQLLYNSTVVIGRPTTIDIGRGRNRLIDTMIEQLKYFYDTDDVNVLNIKVCQLIEVSSYNYI